MAQVEPQRPERELRRKGRPRKPDAASARQEPALPSDVWRQNGPDDRYVEVVLTMGIDRADGSADEPDDADRQNPQYSNPEQKPPLDKPGGPLGIESGRRAEANQTGDGPSGTAGSHNDKNASMPSQETPKQSQSSEHQPTGMEEAVSPLKGKPSYGVDFADLKEEFDARVKSRELPQHNAANDRTAENEAKRSRHSDKLDNESIKERIDPFAPIRQG